MSFPLPFGCMETVEVSHSDDIISIYPSTVVLTWHYLRINCKDRSDTLGNRRYAK